MSKWSAAAWTILALGVLRAAWIGLRHHLDSAHDRRRWKQYLKTYQIDENGSDDE